MNSFFFAFASERYYCFRFIPQKSEEVIEKVKYNYKVRIQSKKIINKGKYATDHMLRNTPLSSLYKAPNHETEAQASSRLNRAVPSI